jgi:hypothetical protein
MTPEVISTSQILYSSIYGTLEKEELPYMDPYYPKKV